MVLKNFEPRLYQQTILNTCTNNNTLVVLPTGMGKTGISLMLAVQRLKQYPKSKILILAPTKPLLDQHLSTFSNHLELSSDLLTTFSGSTSPERRKDLWENSQIIFATPQTIDNDLISGRLSLENVSLICFDECHRAVGDYAYVYISQQYKKKGKFQRILGLTASPGVDIDKINEVILNLDINKIEIRNEENDDVKPYVQDIKMNYVGVEFPKELELIHKNLKLSLRSKLEQIKQNGYINSIENKTKRDLLSLQGILQSQISMGDRSMELMKSISLAAEALKVEHALELLETQGTNSMNLYVGELFSKAPQSKIKAVQNLVNDAYFIRAYELSRKFSSSIPHPKIEKLKEILQGMNPNSRAIIFSHYRDTASYIKENISDTLSSLNLKCETFFGQSSKKEKGMNQKRQAEVLQDFRDGKYNLLIMTSVGEEGLDIPEVDLVIFFEPVPSAIRTVQRRGRTGRKSSGEVYVLFTKGTRDEAYRWSSHHKEKRMYVNIEKIARSLNLTSINNINNSNTNLNQFINSPNKQTPQTKIKIFADTREKSSSIIRTLADNNINVELKVLDAGDYILSKEIGVEFKTVKDFVDSIVDGRLLIQLKKLKEYYLSPLLVIEGSEDIYSIRNVHPNAIIGMLATITTSYKIPVIQTKNSEETYNLFRTIILQAEDKFDSNSYSPHTNKGESLKSQQEYLVSSLPNIGLPVAKELLRNFKSIKNIANSSEAELRRIDLIGEKKAKQIKDVFNEEYTN